MKRGLVILLCLLLLTLLALIGGGAWLLRTEGGARFAFERAVLLLGDRLQVEQVEGVLTGPLRLHGLRYEDDGLRVELRRGQIDWLPQALLAGIVRVDDLQLQGLSVTLKPTPKVKSTSPPITRLPLQVSLEHLLLQEFSLSTTPDAKPFLVARAEFKGSWFGDDVVIHYLNLQQELLGDLQIVADAQLKKTGIDFDRLDVAGSAIVHAKGYLGYAESSDLQLSWENLRWPLQGEPQVTSRSGKAEIKGTTADLKFKTDLALGATAQVQAEGSWRGELDAQVKWTNLAYPLLDPAAPWKSGSGSGRVGGTLERYRFDLTATLDADGVPAKLLATGSGNLDAVDLQRLQLKALDGSLQAQGRVGWSPQLNADLRGSVAGVNPATFLPEWPGEINGDFSVKGVSAEVPDLRFTAQLKNSKLRDYVLALDASGRYHDRTLDFESLTLRSGESQLKARGRALPPFNLTAELDSPDLANVWPGLKGRARLAGGFRGTLDAPHLSLKGSVEQFAYETYKVATAAIDADLDIKAPSHLALTLNRISSGDNRIDTLVLNGDGVLKQHRLKLAVSASQGTASIGVTGGYDAAKRTWKGLLSESQLTAAGLPPWTLAETATLSVSPTSQWLAPACWASGTARACFDGSRNAQIGRAAFRLQGFALAYFKPLMPGGWTLDSTLSGTAAIALSGGELSGFDADLQSTAGELRVRRDSVLTFKPGRLLVQDKGGRTTAMLNLPLKDGVLSADLQLAAGAALMDRPLSGKIDLRIPDLAWLGLLTGEVESAEGRLQGHYTLAGTPRAVRFDGVAELLNGKFQLSTPGITLTDVGARIRGGGSAALQIEAHATSDKGVLRIEGTAGPGANVALTLKGEDFQIAKIPDARAWISPNLKFTLKDGLARLTGSVAVPRADITPKKLDTGIGPTSDQVIVVSGSDAAATPGTRISAEVRINLGDKVQFEGFGLKTKLEGGITAFEEPGRPTAGRGEVRLIDGQYKAYGQDLTIQTGKLLFTGGPLTQPALQLVAVRKPTEAIEVGVRVRGTLDAPEFSLYSTPTMPQQQQLSWLVLGRDLQQSTTGEDRELLSDAALALGLTGGDFLAQGLRKGLGIDEISIGSKPGEDSQQAKLTVGKYLSPKLFIAYGFGIFQPGQVFRILYDIGRGFKLSTETGVNSGGDLLYSIERK